MFLLITKAEQMYLHKFNTEEYNEHERGTSRQNKDMYSDDRE